MVADLQENPITHHREPLADMVRRHIVLVTGLFCITSAIIYFTAPLLPRRYDLAGSMHLPALPGDSIPELAKLPQATLAAIQKESPSAAKVWLTSDNPLKLHLAVRGTNYDTCWVALHTTADQYAALLARQYDEILGTERSKLQSAATRADDEENATRKKIDAFRLSHRGQLPDDPSSIASQYEKLTARLEERRERLQLINNQITRMTNLKKNEVPAAGASIAPIAPTQMKTSDNDPEVLALNAQLQLLNDQLTEQLGTMRRTEQHPYVVELRSKQADLQKKLDAAKERASAGKPPPPEAVANAGTAPGKTTLDLQLETLQAERESLEVDVRTLSAQHAKMQQEMDQLLPARQEFAALNEKLASAKKNRETSEAQIEAFDRKFRRGAQGRFELPEHLTMAMDSDSKLPTRPRPLTIMGLGVVAGALVTGLCVLILRALDRGLHTAKDATTVLDLPVLGAVSEIRSKSQRQRIRLWRLAGQPIAVIAWIVMAVSSASLCVERLEDPHFPQAVQQRGMMSLFFADETGG